MPAWLLPPDSDFVVRFAAWTALSAAALVVLLFVYTLGLRFVTLLKERNRARLEQQWRDIFAAALLSARQAGELPLPAVRRSQRNDLLEFWNRTRSMIRGSAADNLIALGYRMELIPEARRLLARRNLRLRILAIQTLGHMRHRGSWLDMVRLTHSRGVALSITAARALVEIDRQLAVEILLPMIPKRRDWPRTQVSRFLRALGAARVSPAFQRVLTQADDSEILYMLQFAPFVEHEVVQDIAESLIRESNDPALLSAALKLVSGYRRIPRVHELARHDAWYVRMQVARLLGSIGEPEDVPVLEELLDDAQWWVRYRAAQALAKLPFLGPNALRQLQQRQQDRYARDMLDQAFSEVGLA